MGPTVVSRVCAGLPGRSLRPPPPYVRNADDGTPQRSQWPVHTCGTTGCTASHCTATTHPGCQTTPATPSVSFPRGACGLECLQCAVDRPDGHTLSFPIGAGRDREPGNPAFSRATNVTPTSEPEPHVSALSSAIACVYSYT